MISSFRREVDENYALLGYYAANKRIMTIPYRRFGIPYLEPIGGPETSARDYHYPLHNNPEERSSPTHTLTTCQTASQLHKKQTSYFCANSSQSTRHAEANRKILKRIYDTDYPSFLCQGKAI